MTKPICSYCYSEWRSGDACIECGAPKLQALEFIELPRAFRDAFPDSPYWMDGGVSMRADEEVFAVWR